MRSVLPIKRLTLVTAYAALLGPVAAEIQEEQAASELPSPVRITIPGTALHLNMIPVPAADGSIAFWMSDAEISWDHFDVFVYELDDPLPANVDAVTRPTRPYISADRGWGHAGFPALSISHRGAEAFCQWLTARTADDWRLPTLAEWNLACHGGQVTAESLDDYAWNKANSKRRTHKLRSKTVDSLGFFDLQGNVSEWCRTGPGEDDFVLAGGCYQDGFTPCGTVKIPVPEWNDTDPQIPKSIWWLADAPFAGFRVVCPTRPTPHTNGSGDPPK